jgi:hypothetical protein
MARVGTDAWFYEIERWLQRLAAQLPQAAESERAQVRALISEIAGVRVVRGRVRVVRSAESL